MNRIALSIAAAAGLCVPAFAQDSISNLGTGLPGDAPEAFEAGDQVDRYVVDLAPIVTSWGTAFGVAPIHKSPNVDGAGGFFGSLTSAQAISQDTITVNLTEPVEFAEWVNAPGAGVGANNDAEATGSVMLQGEVLQQAAVFAGFSGGSQTINASLINIDPANLSRLYVTRVLAANNQSGIGIGNAFQGGVGGIDANGNAYFRLSDFGTSGNDVTGTNATRVRVQDRTENTLNQITGDGVGGFMGQEATDPLLIDFTEFTDAPAAGTALPASIFTNFANGLGAFPGFDGLYRYGPAAGSMTATAGFLSGGGDTGGTSPRGSFGFTPFTSSRLGGLGLLSNLTRDLGINETGTINVFAVDAMGNPGNRAFFDPPNIAGFVDSANPTLSYDTTNAASIHHVSQTFFNGGSGQTAVQTLANGDLIAAVTLAKNAPGGETADNDPDNVIIAMREAAGAGAMADEAALVAYSDFDGNNKEILDGPGGNVIGELIPFDQAFPTADELGPSMSSPAIDSAGNIWFVSTFRLDSFSELNPGDSGLFRAVYNPESFSYELELILQLGDEIMGVNSGRMYNINFISIADSNSVSSGGFWSSNVSKHAAAGADRSLLSPADAATNGGVVLAATITYDVDLDGEYQDEVSSGGSSSDVDEEYSVLLYIGSLEGAPQPCPYDLDDNGVVENLDVGEFQSLFAADDLRVDFNQNGVLDSGDIRLFMGPINAIIGEGADCADFPVGG